MNKLVMNLFFVLCTYLTLGGASNLCALQRPQTDLTANDLAEALSVHWWNIQLPNDLPQGGEVGVEMVSFDGTTERGCYFTNKKGCLNAKMVRVFCFEDKIEKTTIVSLEEPDYGVSAQLPKDYFRGSALSSLGNGSVLKPGDILLKFDSTKNPRFSGDAVLTKGQFGLRLYISK